MRTTKIKTIKDLVRSSSLPQVETILLVSHLLRKNKEFVLANLEQSLNKKTLWQFKILKQKRLAQMPLAYLLNYQNFYKTNLFINKNVLIPRPETELIIDLVLHDLLNLKFNTDIPPLNIVDIGTGSGAIIINLAQELLSKSSLLYSQANFYALDISQSALQVAKKNIKKYHLSDKINLIKSNLTQKLPSYFWQTTEIFIIANLPYLTKTEIDKEFSLKYEPSLALNAKDELGCKIYQQLFQELRAKDFIKIHLYCELNPQQITYLKNYLQSIFPSKQYQLYLKVELDLRKKNRFLIAKIKKRF